MKKILLYDYFNNWEVFVIEYQQLPKYTWIELKKYLIKILLNKLEKAGIKLIDSKTFHQNEILHPCEHTNLL